MGHISKRKIQVLSLVAVPAIAIALVAFLSWGLGNSSSTPSVEAVSPAAGMNVHLGAEPTKDTNPANDSCDTDPGTAGIGAKCTFANGQTFDLAVYLDSLPNAITAYEGVDIHISYTGVTAKDDTPGAGNVQSERDAYWGGQWPECATSAALSPATAGEVSWGCANASGQPDSTYTGVLSHIPFNCTASGSITLISGDADTSITSAGDPYGESAGGTEVININCPTPTATHTITPTFTPTNTPTNTPTATPPPVPRWMKQQRYPYTNATSQCDPADANNPSALCNQPQDPPKDNLGNLWLTRQGTKIPPLNCVQSSDNAVFSEVLQFSPRVPDPKGVHEFAYIGAFEFEVHFDPKLVCVNLIAGSAASDLGLSCFIDDKAQGQPLEGLARMGCFTKVKNKEFPSDFKTKGPELAQVWVKPQPDLYSQIRPNQDNGIVANLLDTNCELSDEQGHPIPLFSCEDASVTIRYLEGDVEPNCKIDVGDTQNLAMRWGAALGSLLYNTRWDLEPSGTVKGDGDIDIKDLQFIFGRFGSSCGRQVDDNQAGGGNGTLGAGDLKPLPTDALGSPHPRQAPRNPNS